MGRVKEVFDRFSRRPGAKRSGKGQAVCHEVPEETRMRVIIWCRRELGEYWGGILDQVQRRLEMRHPSRAMEFRQKGLGEFLLRCAGEEFLDFLEDLFRDEGVDGWFHAHKDQQQLVEELNEVFREDDLPYYLTAYVERHVKRDGGTYIVPTYPRVVMRESDVLHTEAVEPTLQLLKRPGFESANAEFLEALEDYRKGDFGDCLTKCGSAFESVLKVIAKKKGWPLNEQKDTLGPLVQRAIANTNLETYLEPALIVAGTIRNRLSKSHGAGNITKHVPEHVALYSVNATASGILLVAMEVGES